MMNSQRMSDTGSTSDLREPRWHILFVRSNQEKRVAHHLSERGVEHFLACYEAVRQWKDRRVKLQMPLFPGYIFVHLPIAERMKALTVPNVVSLVGNKSAPSVISEDEIAWIKRGIEGGKAAPHPFLKAGQRVVIIAGPMAGMEGILLRQRNSARVVVSLDSIARSFVVEVDSAWVEPAGPADAEIGADCRALRADVSSNRGPAPQGAYPGSFSLRTA